MQEIKRRFSEYETFVSIEPIIRFTINFAPLPWLLHPWAVAIGYDNYNCNLPEPTQLASARCSAVYQACCVDATTIPYLTKNVNVSLGCYSCRDATDIGDDECLAGIP